MPGFSRRRFIASGCSFALTLHSQIPANGSQAQSIETQRGDPESVNETLSYDAASINRLISVNQKAVFGKRDPNLPLAAIAHARHFLGASRVTTPDQIAKFLALFGLPFSTKEGNVPFCAAGISYAAILAYTTDIGLRLPTNPTPASLQTFLPDLDHYFFYPTPSCVDMYHIAEGRHRWTARNARTSTVPSPGSVVLYDWNHSGSPDHCGLVVNASATSLNTIEFNTSGPSGGSQRNGGVVAEKTRTYEYVMGFITA